jgi:arylsulfatase A-like enzyme
LRITKGSSAVASFWKVFRFIFVVFFLYLLSDVLYRWDGFRYYASFSEFIPSVALISVLWSILAIFFALLICSLFKLLEFFSLFTGRRIKFEYFFVFTCVFIVFGILLWQGKQLLFHRTAVTLQMELTVLFCVGILAIFFTWVSRNKVEKWLEVIQERITPLVWLFGILVMVSAPIVVYHAWIKQSDKTMSQKTLQSIGKNNNRPNIILVTFDALTALDMSVYGYNRPTTPFISEWAKEASLFTRFYSDSNFTVSTTASLMTGKRGWTHRVVYLDSATKLPRGDIESLALLLKDKGYYNMAFLSGRASVEQLGISDSFAIISRSSESDAPSSLIEWKVRGIDVFLYRLFGNKIRLHDWIIKEDFILNTITVIISEDLILNKAADIFFRDTSKKESFPKGIPEFNMFLAALNDSPREPFFAWIHVLPPHSPYMPPEPYIGKFDSSAEFRTADSQLDILRDNSLKLKNSPRFMVEIPETFYTLRARYDEFIRFSDKQFEDFITQLKIRNKINNSVVILSSDHGESFDHGSLGHGQLHLYESQTHIPLIIKEPGQTEGRIINTLAEQVDIPATILDFANIEVPSWMEGRSLAPLIHGQQFFSKPIFSVAAFYKNRSDGDPVRGTIAVWDGDYKLIYFNLDETPESFLFNLKQDPDELNNLLDSEPEVGRRLLALIKNELKKAAESNRSQE